MLSVDNYDILFRRGILGSTICGRDFLTQSEVSCRQFHRIVSRGRLSLCSYKGENKTVQNIPRVQYLDVWFIIQLDTLNSVTYFAFHFLALTICLLPFPDYNLPDLLNTHAHLQRFSPAININCSYYAYRYLCPWTIFLTIHLH